MFKANGNFTHSALHAFVGVFLENVSTECCLHSSVVYLSEWTHISHLV